jgi:hypothetical protein
MEANGEVLGGKFQMKFIFSSLAAPWVVSTLLHLLRFSTSLITANLKKIKVP